MKLMLTSIILSVLAESVICWNNADYSKVVTRFEDLDSLYLRLKETNLLPDKLYKIQTNKDDLFCKTLFQSPYFTTRLETYVQLNSSTTLSEVWKHQRSIIAYFFADPKAFQYCVKLFGTSCLRQHKYKQKTVLVGKTRLPEFVHICLAQQGQTQTFKEYLISRPYPTRMNEKRRNNVAFLFSYNLNGDLVLEALIEEAAIGHGNMDIIKSKFLGEQYLRHKRDDTDGSKNTICQLSESAKLRLCTTMTNMPIYKVNIMKLWPGKFNVEYTCRERQLMFHGHVTKVYKEWTLRCKVISHIAGKAWYLYLSQDSRCDTTVLMYMDSNDKVFLVGRGRSVTVLY